MPVLNAVPIESTNFQFFSQKQKKKKSKKGIRIIWAASCHAAPQRHK